MNARNLLPLAAVPFFWLTWSACQSDNERANDPSDGSQDASERRGDASELTSGQQGEWRYYASDLASSKYSPLRQISRSNAGRLAEAWSWTSPDDAIVQEMNKDGVKIWPHA
ncbi:hypothetical protein LVJ94_05420 [Pendulispora rubella]|uniref:Pyrrolo-quinoline quinone repeat domain-containing protein n=1 Tax=Pendulispora rubella TaxID=2741070 RepID=A0ABZ2LD52_9BACT